MIVVFKKCVAVCALLAVLASFLVVRGWSGVRPVAAESSTGFAVTSSSSPFVACEGDGNFEITFRRVKGEKLTLGVAYAYVGAGESLRFTFTGQTLAQKAIGKPFYHYREKAVVRIHDSAGQQVHEDGVTPNESDLPDPGPYSWGPATASPDFKNTGSAGIFRIATWNYEKFGTSKWTSDGAGWVVDVEGPPPPPEAECELAADEFFGGSNASMPCGGCEDGVGVQGVAGNPVNTRSGNKMESFTDLVVPGLGPGVVWSRSYNSLDDHVGWFGRGWRSSYEMSLSEDSDGVVTVVQENGARVRFVRGVDDGVSETVEYVAPSRVIASLEQVRADGSFVMTRARGLEVLRFDSAGRLMSIGDLDGNETTLVYSLTNPDRLDRVETAAGRALQVSYHPVNGRLMSVSVLDGLGSRTVSYTYTGSGSLLTVTDPENGVWRFGYHGSGLLRMIRSPRHAGSSVNTLYLYDSEGRVVSEQDELQRETVFRYFADRTEVEYPDGDGRVDFYDARDVRTAVAYGEFVGGAFVEAERSSFVFNSATFLAEGITDFSAETSTRSYDGSVLLPTELTDAAGRSVEMSYNEFGLPLTATVLWTAPDGSEFPVTTTYTYGAEFPHRLESVSRPLLADDGSVQGTPQVTEFVYGDAQAPGRVSQVIDPGDRRWRYDYDEHGLLRSFTTPENYSSSGTSLPTRFEYNVFGDRTRVEAPKGAATALLGDYTSSFEFDGLSRLTSMTESENADAPTSFVYDDDGNVVSVTAPGSDGDPNVTVHHYDDAGQLETTVRADGSEIGFGYWPDGLLKYRDDGAGERTEYRYDTVGRPTHRIDPAGRETRLFYRDGRLDQVRRPGGVCATPRTGCTTYRYDPAGLLTSVDYADPDTRDVEHIAYDEQGRRVAVTEGVKGVAGDETVRAWQYNSLGWLTSYQEDLSDPASKVSYTYDKRGNRLKTVYPDGVGEVTYGYDASSRVDTLNDLESVTSEFVWDANSNLTGIEQGAGGFVDTYSYDEADRLSRIVFSNGTDQSRLDYGRTSDGMIETINRSFSNWAGPDRDFGYNALNQLVDYDDAAAGTSTYDYDPADNLQVGPSGLASFDEVNQLCWTHPTATSGTCDIAPAGATTYSFDDWGRRTETNAPSGLTSYEFDDADRLTDVHVPGGGGGAGFVPLPTSEVLDTRPGSANGACPTTSTECSGAFASPTGGTIDVQLAGAGGLPVDPADIEAVVLSVTVRDPAVGLGQKGKVWVWPTGQTRPDNPAIWYHPGPTDPVTGLAGDGAAVTNTVTVPVSTPDGRVRVQANKHTDITIDTLGYYTTDPTQGLVYTALNQTEIADSTDTYGDCANPSTSGHHNCLRFFTDTTDTIPDQYRDIDTTFNIAGMPASIEAVAVNITATNPANDGWFRAYSGYIPNVESVQYVAGQDAVTSLTVPVKTNNRFRLVSSTETDFRVDIVGYFADPATGGIGFTPIDPATVVLDTRTSTQTGTCNTNTACTHLPANTTTRLETNTDPTIPPTADAATLAITAIPSNTNTGHLTVWPDGTPMPDNPTIVFNNGQQTVNTTTLAIPTTGGINIHTTEGTHITIAATGWYGSEGSTYTYQYNSDGLRTRKTGPGTDLTYRWDLTQPIPQLLTIHDNNTNTTASLVYTPTGNALKQTNHNNTNLWYHTDHQGTTRFVTDNTGTILNRYLYDPWGNHTTNNTPTPTNTPILTYTNQQHDPETGLYYLRARYYEPTTGQFLTIDPLVAQTREPYAYVSNNPVNGTDPTGLCGPFGDGGCPGGSLVPDSVSDAVGSGAEVVREAAQDVGEFVVRNRGTIATVGAVGVCVGFSLGACAIATGGGYLMRSTQAIQERGWDEARGSIAIDGAITAATFGLVSVPASHAFHWSSGRHLIPTARGLFWGAPGWQTYLSRGLTATPDVAGLIGSAQHDIGC